MLRIVRDVPPLTDDAMERLATLQETVNEAGNYATRTEAAKTKWGNAKKDVAPFVEIKEALVAMCSGHRRCAYCEDSVADEIEHFRPKDLYPEAVFVWENYLYSCGPCNGPKNNKFAVIEAGDDDATDVTRARGETIVEPPTGEPALLDPRVDDPLDYLVLDIVDTFTFRPRPRISARKRARAEYTIELLRLNERSYLLEGRRTSYEALVCALQVASAARNADALADIQRPARVVAGTPHRCVWEEMKRQRAKLDELVPLFEAVPEAADW